MSELELLRVKAKIRLSIRSASHRIQRDSNPRPFNCEANALPSELPCFSTKLVIVSWSDCRTKTCGNQIKIMNWLLEKKTVWYSDVSGNQMSGYQMLTVDIQWPLDSNWHSSSIHIWILKWKYFLALTIFIKITIVSFIIFSSFRM